MKTLMSNLNWKRLTSMAIHAVAVTIGDAMLCAVAGALYCMVIGGFGPQARNELTMHGLISIGGLGALAGFVFGIALGIYNEAIRTRTTNEQLNKPSLSKAALARHSAAIPTTRIRNVLKSSLVRLSRTTKSDVSTAAR